MKDNKNLKQWLAIIMVGLFTFLSVIQAVPIRVEDAYASGKFDNSELTSVLPSAYYATKNTLTSDGSKFGDKSKQFTKNIKTVTDDHFGNIGLFVGFPGESESQMSALNTSNAISINESNNHFDNSQVKQYYAFGAAVQDLSKRGIKSKKVEESAQKTVDGITNSAKSLTKAGARLVKDYDPTPLLLSLYLTEGGNHNNQWVKGIPNHINLDNEAGDNKLVAIVQNNPTLSSILEFLRISPTGSDTASMTLFSWIVFGMVIMLIVTGVLMKVINGRAAGENYRKAVVKIFISSLAIPVMATLLYYGVNTFVDVVDPDVTPEEEYAKKAIGEHLNFADWYATGFAVPDGMELTIEDDRFKLGQEQIRAINIYSYNLLNKSNLGNSEKDATKVYDRLLKAGNQNFAQPSFVEKNGWDGMAVKQAGATIVKNEDGDDVDVDGESSGGVLSDLFKKITGGASGSYLYGFRNTMSPTSGGYKVLVDPELDASAGNSNKYGMSPLASYNMMRSSFSGGNITSSLAKPQMASVVYTAFVGGDGKEMNGIVKLIATYAMVMAAMKGLALIFASGIGGIFSGAASGGLGSTAGMGQGIGGIIALLAGVLGMGLIMNISFIFLDELYSIFHDIFTGTKFGDPTMLDPLKDMVDDLPIAFFKPFLKGALESFATLAITIASAIALPKFGKIPINLFAQKMSELPSNFAEKAQRMENRFTGDYRAGATGRGSTSAAFNSQVSQIAGDTKNQMSGVGEAAAAGGGMLLGLAGGGIASLADKMMGDKEEGDLTMNNSPEDGGGPDDGGGSELGAIPSGEENYEGQEINKEDNLEGNEINDNKSVGENDTGVGEDKKEVKEGGNKNSIHNAKSEKDTNASQKDSISGENKSVEGNSKVDEANKEDSTNIEGNVSDEASQQNIDGNSQEVDGSKSIADEGANINQTGGETQTDVSSDFAGNETQSMNQANKEDTSINASNDMQSNLSADQNQSVQQSQDVKQNSDSFINSQSSSVNAGVTEGQSVSGEGQTGNKIDSSTVPVSGSGVSSVGTGGSKSEGRTSPSSQGSQEKSQGGSSKGNNLNSGTPSMSNKSNNQKTKTNQGVVGNNQGGVSQSGQSTQSGGGAPPHNPPKDTLNNKTGGVNAQATPKKNTSFRMKAAKLTKTLGQSMQATGGEVSTDRVVKAMKHGATSAFVGGHAQQRTQADLNRVQGKVNVPRTNSPPPQPNVNAGPNNKRESQILSQENLIEDEERNK